MRLSREKTQRGAIEAFLAAEVVIHRGEVDVRRVDDLAHARARKAVTRELLGRSVDQLSAGLVGVELVVVGEHPLLPFAPLFKRGAGARNAAFETFVYGKDSSCFTDLWQAFLEENLQLKHCADRRSREADGRCRTPPGNAAENGLQGMIGTMKKTTPRARRTTGFTLIEIVMVLLIFGIGVAMAAAITRGVAASQKRSLTTQRIAGVDAALVQFVQQQRRLPCPGDGTKASSDNNAGVEMRAAGACTANQQNDVVPWRTLALTETDATDGWDRRLTYRLDPALGLHGGMDISSCDPAGTKGVVPPALCSNACLGTGITPPARPVDFLRGPGPTERPLPA